MRFAETMTLQQIAICNKLIGHFLEVLTSQYITKFPVKHCDTSFSNSPVDKNLIF